MPIQITNVASVAEVDAKLRELEALYNMTTVHVVAEKFCVDVPEDDLIEWNFLCMQREALMEGSSSRSLSFNRRPRTALENLEMGKTYLGVAA